MDSSRRALWTNEKLFLNFKLVCEILGENTKNIHMNSDSWILIKLRCVTYQWTRLDKLYKLMESFLQISESFFELVI